MISYRNTFYFITLSDYMFVVIVSTSSVVSHLRKISHNNKDAQQLRINSHQDVPGSARHTYTRVPTLPDGPGVESMFEES